MSTSIETKLRIAALADSTLVSLLQTGSGQFRWYNTQLVQGSAYPAIVVNRISGAPLYVNVGRNPLSQIRVQFTIWEGPNPGTTDGTLEALREFLDTFSATGISSQAPNTILNVMSGLFAETQPGIFQTILDAMIWNNDSL